LLSAGRCLAVFALSFSLLITGKSTTKKRRARRFFFSFFVFFVCFVVDFHCFYAPTDVGSTRIPGPIVVATFTFLTYLPFAVAGLALITASINAFALAVILSAEKETLPTGT